MNIHIHRQDSGCVMFMQKGEMVSAPPWCVILLILILSELDLCICIGSEVIQPG